MVYINPHPPLNPVTSPKRSTSVEPSARPKPVHPREKQVQPKVEERRRRQDRRKETRDQGLYDMRSGRDRRRNRQPTIEIDV